MTAYPFNQGDVNRLQARYKAWKRERDVLLAMDASSHWPAPGVWQGNDSRGIELLESVAVLLGWDR